MEKMSQMPINWVDGMKISKREFIALENYLLDQVRDANNLGLTDYNFGLLPALEPGREPLSVDISPERVELYYCRAVTRAGARIEIIDLEESALRRSMRDLMGDFDFSQAREWYVIVRVHPFERIPYGKPAPDTQSLRHLSAIPRYELGIIPKEQTTSTKIAGYAIPIAKIVESPGRGIEQVRNYIPPCARLSSSPELLRVQQQLEQEMSAILRDATVIVRKINYRSGRESINTLAMDISQVATQTMAFLNNNFDAYRLVLPQQPPLMLVEYFARFARTVDTALEMTRGKDAMLNYFQQYVQRFQFAEFNACLTALTSNLLYNHFEVRQSLDKIAVFVEQMRNLLDGLGRLNYEQLPKFDLVINTTTVGQNQGFQQPQPPIAPQKQGGNISIKPKDERQDRLDTRQDTQKGDADNPFGFK